MSEDNEAKTCSKCQGIIPAGEEYCASCTSGWEEAAKRIEKNTMRPAGRSGMLMLVSHARQSRYFPFGLSLLVFAVIGVVAWFWPQNQGDRDSWGGPDISDNGQLVVFQSADPVVPEDTNANHDIFVYGRPGGTITRVSVDSSGMQGDGGSGYPTISGDGRYVAFDSFSTNLTAGDTNETWDIFVHDTETGTAKRVSVSSAGKQGDKRSGNAAISGDGRFVTFESDATNLVAGDTNSCTDVFVHDMETGATRRVSVGSAGEQGDKGSYNATISAEGRLVVFESDADDLVAGDSNYSSDVFVHDIETGLTQRVSVDSARVQGDGSSYDPSISADGRYVAFSSYAESFVSDGSGQEPDLFVHDVRTGAMTRLSREFAEDGPWSYAHSSISADGRLVCFVSNDSDVVPGHESGSVLGSYDIFVLNCQTGAVDCVSESSSGDQAAHMGYRRDCWSPAISADGRYVVFLSDASTLDPPHNSIGLVSVYVHDIAGGTTTYVR